VPTPTPTPVPTPTPIVTHTITASAGTNGSISPSGGVTVNDGASQGFTLSPNSNYHVADVLIDGGSVGAVSSYTFTSVTADHTISASFAIDTYTLTVTQDPNGTISPGTTVVNAGSDQSFTITADQPGFTTITDVIVDGTSLNTGPYSSPYTYTFTIVTANHTITATFGP
jgi:hypothetical protein